MRRATIYKPTKSAMQSGDSKEYWLLEFDESYEKYIEPHLGYTGSKDTKQQLRMKFPNKDAAVKFAQEENIEFEVIEPKSADIQIKAYADNFLR